MNTWSSTVTKSLAKVWGMDWEVGQGRGGVLRLTCAQGTVQVDFTNLYDLEATT